MNGGNRRERIGGAGLWTGTVHSGDAMYCCGAWCPDGGKLRGLEESHLAERQWWTDRLLRVEVG